MNPTMPGDFRLPPDVSLRKERLSDGWAYVFRHRTLGELGRILLQETEGGHCRISCEVVGDPSDPKTAERLALFKPLSLELAGHVEAAKGTVPEAEWGRLPPPPPSRKELIESKLIPCERCGMMVAMLIFAPEATDAGRFEDYARLMYPEYSRLDLPSWIIGPPLGGGPPINRPAEILQVWPTRAPIECLRPAKFNRVIDRLAAEHCCDSDA